MNNIKEIKEFINSNGNYEGDLDNFLDEHNELDDFKFKYVDTLENDEHRWYILSTNVYEVYKENALLGNLAICEVMSIKSESTCMSDLCIDIEAYEVRKIVKESFEIISEVEE